MTTLKLTAALLFGTLGIALAPTPARAEYREAGLRSSDDVYWETGGVDHYAMRFYIDENRFLIKGFDFWNRLMIDAAVTAQGGGANWVAATLNLRDPSSGETASLYTYSAVEEISDSRRKIWLYSSLDGRWDYASLTYDGDNLVSVDSYNESAELLQRSPMGPRFVSDYGASSNMSTAFYSPENMAKWRARAMQDRGFMKAGWWKSAKSWVKKAARDTGKLLNDVAHSSIAKKVALVALYGVVIVEAAACGYAIAQSGGAAAPIAKPCAVAVLATLAAASATAETADDGAARIEIMRSERLQCMGCYAIASAVFGGGRIGPEPVQ